jgi:hypothetical protein
VSKRFPALEDLNAEIEINTVIREHVKILAKKSLRLL